MRPLFPRGIAASVLCLGLACAFGREQVNASEWRITVQAPGAAPEQVEAGVLEPIEAALVGLPGIERVQGLAGHGVATITVTGAGDDPVAVVQALSSVSLRPGTQSPVLRRTGEARWIVVPSAVADRALLTLQAEPGVKAVFAHGLPGQQVVVTLDLARLLAYGIELGDVVAALQRTSDGELEHVVIAVRAEVAVHMGDVASVSRGFAGGLRAQGDGAPAVVFEVISDRDDLAAVVGGRPVDALTRVELRGAGWEEVLEGVVLGDEGGGTLWTELSPDQAADALASQPGPDAFVRDPDARCTDHVIAADDLDVLETAVAGVRAHFGATPGVTTWTAWEPAKPRPTVTVDRDRAAAMGVSAARVVEVFGRVTSGHPVATRVEDTRAVDVVIDVPDAADLADLRVDGVPIGALARVEVVSERTIPHVDARRGVVVVACGNLGAVPPLPGPAEAPVRPR